MKSCVFWVSLLTGAVSIFALTAGEPPRPFQSNDPPKVGPLREEEVERPLAALLGRCQRMLDLQMAVSNDTRGLHKIIQGTADKKPRPEDQQASLRLADNAKAIVTEATQAIDMLEAEGSAVAFAEVFRELRKDMQRVQRRLEISDVGPVTQTIEQEIIDTLTEMIGAVGKG